VAWVRRLKGTATASRMQPRRGGESPGRSTDDAEPTAMAAGHVQPRTTGSAVAGCGGWPHRGAGDGRGGSHGRQRRSHPANRAAPRMMRADGTPHTRRTQPKQIYRDRNPFPADRRRTSPAGKPPLMAGSMGTYAEFVIAVADLEHCRYSALACPACSIGSNVAKYSIRSR
jgi:hypothetical protein